MQSYLLFRMDGESVDYQLKINNNTRLVTDINE